MPYEPTTTVLLLTPAPRKPEPRPCDEPFFTASQIHRHARHKHAVARALAWFNRNR